MAQLRSIGVTATEREDTLADEFDPVIFTNGLRGYSENIKSWVFNRLRMIPGDFNGDGKTDIVAVFQPDDNFRLPLFFYKPLRLFNSHF